jgi:DNA end-binding protein Ku
MPGRQYSRDSTMQSSVGYAEAHTAQPVLENRVRECRMERPLWSGELVLGIVSIGVRMFPAVRDLSVHFNQISRKDHRRIRYLKVAEGDNEEVPAAEIAKGYQVADGRYVLFTDEELKRLAPVKSKTITIDSFVKLDEIDPRLFDRPYYLAPQERSEKPYRLLVEALARSSRVGIAQMVMHNKEYLVAVRSLDGVLAVETMHFQDEIIQPTSVPHGRTGTKVAPRELEMAEKLIDTMSGPFDPEHYVDEYRQRLKQAIARKSRGKPFLVDEPEREVESGKVIDLMDALKKSIESKARTASSPRRPRPARKHAS